MNAALTALDLTRLDPTRDAAPDPASPAAEALLARVLATPRTPTSADTSTTTTTSRRAARLRRRWVLVGAAAAVTAAGLVVAQVASDAGTPQAFASWTPDPTPLTADQAAGAATQCYAAAAMMDGSAPTAPPVAALADIRGDYLSAFVASEQGIAQCLSAAPGHHDPHLGDGDAGVGVATWLEGRHVAEPAPDGTNVVWGGGFAVDEQRYTAAYGRAGVEVTSVVLTDSDGRRVAATLHDGWFSAWWPSAPTRSLTVQTTLADGRTTEREVAYHHPS